MSAHSHSCIGIKGRFLNNTGRWRFVWAHVGWCLADFCPGSQRLLLINQCKAANTLAYYFPLCIYISLDLHNNCMKFMFLSPL